jgi:hypothetical protein
MFVIPPYTTGALIVAVQQILREHSENISELTFAMATAESYSAAAAGFSERRFERTGQARHSKGVPWKNCCANIWQF